MYDNPTLDDVIKRLHWSNTQPMWEKDNMKKGNRYASLNSGMHFIPLTLNVLK
jgi:hypothetical protein